MLKLVKNVDFIKDSDSEDSLGYSDILGIIPRSFQKLCADHNQKWVGYKGIER